MKSKIVYSHAYKCDLLFVCGVKLDIGNNFTLDHVIAALYSEVEKVIDLIEAADIDLNDMVMVQFNGNYGKGHIVVSMSDLSDYLRYYNNIYYPRDNLTGASEVYGNSHLGEGDEGKLYIS